MLHVWPISGFRNSKIFISLYNPTLLIPYKFQTRNITCSHYNELYSEKLINYYLNKPLFKTS